MKLGHHKGTKVTEPDFWKKILGGHKWEKTPILGAFLMFLVHISVCYISRSWLQKVDICLIKFSFLSISIFWADSFCKSSPISFAFRISWVLIPLCFANFDFFTVKGKKTPEKRRYFTTKSLNKPQKKPIFSKFMSNQQKKQAFLSNFMPCWLRKSWSGWMKYITRNFMEYRPKN